ncbi:MAG: hypothetical protein H6738_13380 [Alphaproteobacteria bacterium]|nr:hypothetical protein [Alphaproteobacteria bacterium]MCB9697769.1 hypothetical protein [Alphaproteobacteria bacterium]
MGVWTEDERRFLAVLGWWTCVGMMTSVAIARTEPVPWVVEAPVVEGYARIARERVPVRLVEPTPVERPTVAAEEVPAPASTPVKAQGKAARRSSKGDGAVARLQLLGTLGIADRFTTHGDEGGSAELLRAAAAGVELSREGGPRQRAGAPGLADAPEIEGIGGGSADVTSLSATARSQRREERVDDAPPQMGWRGLDRAQQGDVKLCYERELKAHPGLGGRVELAVTSDGVRVVSNATGSEALARCIEKAARSWTLPAGAAGARLPVVLVE